MDLAQCLSPLVEKVKLARLASAKWPGLWDWLAAFYFDSICPRQPDGTWKIKAQPLYSVEQSWRRYYRHRIYGPVELFQRLGPSAQILIHGNPSTLTDWEEQAAGRIPISSNSGIADALHQLYWDSHKNTPKPAQRRTKWSLEP